MIKKNPIKSFTGDGRECTPESRIVKIGLEFWNRIRNVHHLFPRLCCCGRSRILHRPCVRQTKPGLQTGRLAHSPTAVRERALHQIHSRGGFLSQWQILLDFGHICGGRGFFCCKIYSGRLWGFRWVQQVGWLISEKGIIFLFSMTVIGLFSFSPISQKFTHLKSGRCSFSVQVATWSALVCLCVIHCGESETILQSICSW